MLGTRRENFSVFGSECYEEYERLRNICTQDQQNVFNLNTYYNDKHTGIETHPVSPSMGTGPLSRGGLKRPERSVNTPLPSRAEVKETVKLQD
jgi:hypothetical protein